MNVNVGKAKAVVSNGYSDMESFFSQGPGIG